MLVYLSTKRFFDKLVKKNTRKQGDLIILEIPLVTFMPLKSYFEEALIATFREYSFCHQTPLLHA